LTIVIVIAIMGLIVYAIQTYVPMPAWAKGLISVVCVLFVLLWLLDIVQGHSLLHWRGP
jgi:hypothetical protein